MRLGTRWVAGAEPPAAVPEVLRDGIRAVDAQLEDDGLPQPYWTLTWLEGRPIADLETGVIVTLDCEGHLDVLYDEDAD